MNQIRLYIWGDYACFTRPEMKVERAVGGARDFGGGALEAGDSLGD